MTQPSTGNMKANGLTKPMKLSNDLADIVGKNEASRSECVKQIWAYLKKNNLQDPNNKQFFIPDKKMAKVFGTDHIRSLSMAKYLSAHLTPVNSSTRILTTKNSHSQFPFSNFKFDAAKFQTKFFNCGNSEDKNQFLKLVKNITSKGFVRSNYKKNLVDLSDIKINLKGKK